jgi:AcrR family transcriptional regulator
MVGLSYDIQWIIMESASPMSRLSDARVVRTRQALRQAMTELAEELPLESITVRAIAVRAGVGYATFFRHYPDKEALLSDVADVLTQAFLARIRPLLQQRERRAAARSLCAFVLEHEALYRALIAGGSGETVRAEMLRQCLATVAEVRTRQPDGPLDDLIVLHLVSSTLYLTAWWLRNLATVDVETMAEIVERLVLTPVGGLRRQPPASLGPEQAAADCASPMDAPRSERLPQRHTGRKIGG